MWRQKFCWRMVWQNVNQLKPRSFPFAGVTLIMHVHSSHISVLMKQNFDQQRRDYEFYTNFATFTRYCEIDSLSERSKGTQGLVELNSTTKRSIKSSLSAQRPHAANAIVAIFKPVRRFSRYLALSAKQSIFKT